MVRIIPRNKQGLFVEKNMIPGEIYFSLYEKAFYFCEKCGECEKLMISDEVKEETLEKLIEVLKNEKNP